MSSDRRFRTLEDRLNYPGHGLPERIANLEVPLDGWARLAAAQALGKKTTLYYDATDPARQPAAVPILRVEGSDLDASQLIVTLLPPMIIALPFASLPELAQQSQTGEQDNVQIGTQNFPGEIHPVAWPPIQAIVEWGIGGSSAYARVDFMTGTTINVGGASFVNVYAVIGADAIHVPGTSALYTLAANVGPGRPRDGIAQCSIYLGAVAAGDSSAVFAVPPYAKHATVIGMDGAADPQLTSGFLRFWQSPDASKNMGNYFANGNQPGPFNVPNGGAYFTVDSGGTMPYAVVFELAI